MGSQALCTRALTSFSQEFAILKLNVDQIAFFGAINGAIMARLYDTMKTCLNQTL